MSAAQVSLFDLPQRERASNETGQQEQRPAIELRPYQLEAKASAFAKLAAERSTLIVCPTGTGKTRIGSAIVAEWPGPVLWAAHREELIDQGRRDLARYTGEQPAKEKADEYAYLGARLVVGSVQTLKAARLANFAQRHKPSLIVVDEAHHAVSPSYRAILDAFPDAKVLGLTATPDRADELAMGQVFDSVAFVYEIQDAIREGYLCRIKVQRVLVDAINLSAVRTVAGDLNQGDLDAVMAVEEVIHGVVRPTLELAGNRRTIMFTTAVETAHRMAEVFNRYRANSARAVDGGTPIDERRDILRGHKAGEYQFLCNVGVLTEGYDDPGVSCIGIARPTKSRALYAQCAGRGLRIYPGKSDCLLLDFVGNSGRHALVSGLDILDGKYDEEVVAKAKEIANSEADGIDAQEALERAAREIDEARKREAARRARVTASVSHRVVEVDPFAVFQIDRGGDDNDKRFGMAASEKQLNALGRFKIPVPEGGMSRAAASQLLAKAIERSRSGLATFGQLKCLQRAGIVHADHITFEGASRLIGALKGSNYRLSHEQVAALLERAPGQEG